MPNYISKHGAVYIQDGENYRVYGTKQDYEKNPKCFNLVPKEIIDFEKLNLIELALN